jgi:hypothetical protein
LYNVLKRLNTHTFIRKLNPRLGFCAPIWPILVEVQPKMVVEFELFVSKRIPGILTEQKYDCVYRVVPGLLTDAALTDGNFERRPF